MTRISVRRARELGINTGSEQNETSIDNNDAERKTVRPLDDVQRDIAGLNTQIQELSAKLLKLRREEQARQFEKLWPVVGMAFRTKTGDVRIIGLPLVVPRKAGDECNMHELPVLIIDNKHDEVVPVYEGTLYTQAVESDDPEACLRSEYEEMNAGDWFAELDDALEKMKGRI